MLPTPSSSNNELVQDGFNKLEWYKALGIVGTEPRAVGVEEIIEAFKKAGDMIRTRYGDRVFHGELGRKVAQDLKNLKPGAQFRVVEKDLLIVIEGAPTGFQVEVGFSGEPAKTALVEGKSRLNESLGLKFLQTGEAHGL